VAGTSVVEGQLDIHGSVQDCEVWCQVPTHSSLVVWLVVVGLSGMNEVGWMGRGFATVDGTLGGCGPKNDIAIDLVQFTTLVSFHFFLFFIHCVLPL